MNYTEFTGQIPDGFRGYVLAQLTDEYLAGEWPAEKDSLAGKEDKILEVRVFDPNAEYKLFRSHIGAAFRFRSIRDDDGEKREFFDQDQFLDIDAKRSANSIGEGYVFATGGGRYRLPKALLGEGVNLEGLRIRIRCYFGRYENGSGQAKIGDWRVVDFVGGKE